MFRNDELSEMLIKRFVESSDKKELERFFDTIFNSCNYYEIDNLLYLTTENCESKEKIKCVIEILENYFLTRSYKFLASTLAVLHNKIHNTALTEFYIRNVRNNMDIYKKSRQYSNIAEIEWNRREILPDVSGISFSEYDKTVNYTFDDKSFRYSVFSLSKKIGKNMTLLKTRYGTLIFDCGAAITTDGCEQISSEEFLEFLDKCNTKVSDVLAVIISHAHFDHYGSVMQIKNAGISEKKIFINFFTKKLINAVSDDVLCGEDISSTAEFQNNSISITPYNSGHILGAEAYLVSFDNINILYTGDFCTHKQKTVDGLNPEIIKDNRNVQEYGLDCIITESTYGLATNTLEYRYAGETMKYFVDKLNTMGYKILISSFAIGRTQEIALLLNDKFKIVIDGLASELSQLYDNLLTDIDIYNQNTRNGTLNSASLNNFDKNDIVLCSSGMLSENSTSLEYVKKVLDSSEKIAIIKTGYISSESYGNEFLSKWADNDKILLDIPLSAHAAREEIFDMIMYLEPHNVVAVHGEGLGIV